MKCYGDLPKGYECPNDAIDGAFWCTECERLRQEHLTERFKDIDVLFDKGGV